MVTIYTISDANTGLVQYVGATMQPLKSRLIQHRGECRLPVFRGGSGNAAIEPLETVGAIEDVTDAERFWISQMKTWGFTLHNRGISKPYKGNVRKCS